MKLQCAVVDDNTSVLKLIKESIQEGFRNHNIDSNIETFSSCPQFEKRRKEAQFDIVFLDINMPEMDGIDYAKFLKDHETESKIVFVSSREERVFEAIQLQPFGFVRKSSFLQDLSEVIERYSNIKKEDTGNTTICVTVHGRKKTFSIKNIAYFEGCGALQIIHLLSTKDVEEASSSMETLENSLKEHGFMRVHKGYLVNFFAISGFDGPDLLLTNGERIPISRRKLQTVKSEFLELCKKYSVLTF